MFYILYNSNKEDQCHIKLPCDNQVKVLSAALYK